jgi:hypothetical protein
MMSIETEEKVDFEKEYEELISNNYCATLGAMNHVLYMSYCAKPGLRTFYGLVFEIFSQFV